MNHRVFWWTDEDRDSERHKEGLGEICRLSQSKVEKQLVFFSILLWIYQVNTLISDPQALFINKTIKEPRISGIQSWS